METVIGEEMTLTMSCLSNCFATAMCSYLAWLQMWMVLRTGFSLKNFFSHIFPLKNILKNFVDAFKGSMLM